MNSRRARWRVARIVIGTLLAAAALYVSFLSVDRAQLWAAFGRANPQWLGAGLGSVMVTLSLVTWRWRWLVGEEPGGTPRWRPLWDSVVIGQAVNIVFPLRFGEGARVAVTCGELGYSMGRVMVGMALERALDVSAFATVVVMLLLAGRMPDAFRSVLPTVAVLIAATITIIVSVVWLMPVSLRWLRERAGRRSRLAVWLQAQETSLRSGWADVTRGPRVLAIVALTAVGLVSSASTNFLIFRAFDLPVPPIAALVLLAVLQVGTAVVSVPGNIGVFHYLTVLTLATWHVPQSTALATAIVLHIVSLGPRVALGAVAAAGMRLRRAVTPISEGNRS